MAVLLPGVQSNSIALSMKSAFQIPVEITGGAIVLLLALIIFGGVKRIGKVAEFVVPFMAIGYILLAVIIMILNFEKIPGVFALILTSAFNLEAAYSGVFGLAISW
jgi:AGCS family alanine or glycine:cation symporter